MGSRILVVGKQVTEQEIKDHGNPVTSLAYRLSREGHEPVPANGEGAVRKALAANHGFGHVVIHSSKSLDFGVETLRMIRQNPDTACTSCTMICENEDEMEILHQRVKRWGGDVQIFRNRPLNFRSILRERGLVEIPAPDQLSSR